MSSRRKTFPVHEIGNELIQIYEKTGVGPFNVQHQGQLTPLQKSVIAKTIKHNNEKKREKMDNAKSGGGPGPQSSPKNGAYDKKKQMLKEQHGAGSDSYQNQDFDPDKPLVMDEDEVMHKN